MMKPIRVQGDEGEATVYACIHWRNFPAPFARMEGSAEDLRAQKVLDEVGYQRHKTWEAQCGLLAMDESKCLSCPHIRRLEIQPHHVPKMWTLDGKESTPAIDIPAVTSMPKYRRMDLKAQARASQEQARNGRISAQEAEDAAVEDHKSTRGE